MNRPLDERRERWAALVEMTESTDPVVEERLRAWLEAKSAEIRQRKRKPCLFLVPKPAQKPEQIDLDFSGESQREVEHVIADVLEQNRRPKVG